ncbi:MAG TPA: hypothetical protein VJJ52_08190 [Candidatus Nanoarchaeia archaeon]|nr:hypothetical protein [Candidatus Nanoarchaeia archaeon]
MVDYKVLSPHLDTSKVHSYTTAIPADKIKSMQHLTSTVSSFPYGPSTYHLVDGNLVTVTSGNKFWTTREDAKKYGTFFSQLDDGVRRGSVKFASMDDWIANGTMEKPNLPKNQPIPTLYDLTNNKVGGVIYVEGATPLGLWLPDRNDTQVNLYTTPRLAEGANDMNGIGKRTSQVGELWRKLHSGVLFNEKNELHYEITKWAEFLNSKGVHPKKHPFLGLGVERFDGSALAGLYPDSNYLVIGSNFHEKAKEWASRYGLTDAEAVEALERYSLMHELAHAYGISGTHLGERRQGQLQTEFYSKLAADFKGTKWERVYKTLAHMGEDYAESYSLSSLIKQEFTKDPNPHSIRDIFVYKAKIEGREMGLNGGHLEKYVKLRLKDGFGELYKGDENEEPKHNTQRRAGLETIVESRVQEAANSHSNNLYSSKSGKVLAYSKKGKSSKVKGDYNGQSKVYEFRKGERQTRENTDSREADAKAGEERTDSHSENTESAEGDKGEASSDSPAKAA